MPLGHYTDRGPIGLGQYKSLGEYCGPHTASSVFLILVSLLDVALGHLPLDATLIMTEIPCQLPYDLDPLNVMMTS